MSSQRGFALLITITLLGFLVVLLLGLAVYTRVETSVAGNTQRQAQARENALLGLEVALAQLQRHAGPDTRVTATAANFKAVDGTRHYTGVWATGATSGEPLTWLVSGNELPRPDIPNPDPDAPEGSTIPAPLAVTPETPGTRLQTLVGRNSTGDASRSANWVDAPLVDVTAAGVPGVAPTAPPATIGRYAWWVGDQGVKAPVAIADTTDAIAYLPFDTPELKRRIRQAFALGPAASEGSSGAPIFEPRDASNAPLLAGEKISAANQLAFLRTSTNTPLGLARVQQNFHAFSPNNFAVLADTKNGGLQQDLSLEPTLLGTAFAAWANYPAYMEKFRPDPPPPEEPPADPNAPPPTPVTPATPPPPPPFPILPAYGDDPIRRRYLMTPHLRPPAENGSHQVGAVLADFGLTFNVRTIPTGAGNPSSGVQPLEVRAAWMLSLWNPYTSALVPEQLRLEITGLPEVSIIRELDGAQLSQFSLQDVFGVSSGEPLRIALPWDKGNTPTDGPEEDRNSWLPGRVYTWRSIEDVAKGPPPSDGFPSKFYTRSFTAPGETNRGVQRSVPGSADGDDVCRLDVVGNPQLRFNLYAVRDGEPILLGRFTSPSFLPAFQTTAGKINLSGYQFGYAFRLKESIDTIAAPATWLTTPTIDFRRSTVQGEAYVFDNGDNPAVYANQLTDFMTQKPDRLLFRSGDAYSYNEDVPLFELPRAPLLSLGALQHFRIQNSRPFMIGNPWGAQEHLNGIRLGALFDRFFFSGLVEGVVPTTSPTGDLILPNPLLKPLRKPDQGKVTIEDLRNMITPPVEADPDGNVIPGPAPSSHSSKYFLQAGAFNLNSVNVAAWASVLRGVRFPAPHAFTYLDASEATGTADDVALAGVESTEAHFFRFSQSAQETYKSEPGLADNDPNAPSPANTHLFRRGVRTLTGAEVAALAAKIVELVGVKHAAETDGGPFRSLEEFLSPSALFAGVDEDGNPLAPRSLLEAAIADAGINASIAEFSSQWLTQADVMTALAPVLFPRSDTFVIRTYGEAVNPATNAVEGRAWAEAVVQRVPEYVDPSLPPETPPTGFEPVPNPDDPDLPPTSTPAQDLNKTLGRRFKVVSFRWLTRSDI